MKVLVTGAAGFAGRWLTAELQRAGHEVVAAPSHRELDLATSADLAPLLAAVWPDTVAHLAAVSFGPDAERDPAGAMATNGRGTAALFDGLQRAGSAASVLVVSSSEVYGRPDHLPIREDAPLLADRPYGRSKVEQERVSLAAHAAGRRVVIARSFNHLGPGQRASFAAPSFARRVLALRDGSASDIPVGNLDVRRDYTDVRDIARAYRLLLEALVAGRVAAEPPVFNVGSGRSIPIRELVATLCRLAGVEMRLRVDPALVRENEVPDLYGDATALRTLTGWQPEIPLERSLADLLASLAA